MSLHRLLAKQRLSSHNLPIIVAGIILCLGTWTPEILADDHNFDAGPGSDVGVATPWDTESVNPLGGNLHVAIPLYSVDLGPDFKMSLELQYDSLMWDASDPAYSSGWIPARMVRGKDPAGLGWRLNIPRVRRIAYRNLQAGTVVQTFYYFQSADGGMHRLYRDGCTNESTWNTQDQSGIRAESVGTANGVFSKWTVWEPSGTKYIMEHLVTEDFDDDAAWYFRVDHYDTTRIESATRTSGTPPEATRWINIQWEDSQVWHPDDYHRYCPTAMIDSYGRAVTFECSVGSTPRMSNQDGGKVSSISFAGTPDPITGISRTLRYRLSHEYREVIDPFSTLPCPTDYPGCPHNVPRPGILILTDLSLEVSDGELFNPVSPPKTFAFEYDNSGMLTGVTLPGGGRRTYDYAPAHYWRSVFPDSFDTPALQEQFNFFPSYGLRRRTLEVDGRSYEWRYTRDNENCSEAAYDQCFNHPNKVTVLMPSDYMNPSAPRSTTVYRYRATRRNGDTSDGGHVAPGTTLPLDGALASVEVYAGSEAAGRLVRKSLFEYAYDTPPSVPACNTLYNLLGHTVDGVRLSKRTTVIEDDRKPTHDKRVVEYSSWTNLTGNTRAPGEIREYNADGTTLYRKTTLGYQTVAGPDGNSMPRRSWTRVLRADGTPLAETSYAYNASGQTTTVRQLYQPGGSPGAFSSSDILRTVTYEPATGLPSRVDVGTGAQPTAFGETYGWDWGYLSSRRTVGFAYDSFHVARDQMTGAVIEDHRPSGGGQRFEYTESGEPAAIRPLAGSADPVTTYEYASNQRTTMVGDPASSGLISRIDIMDGLGRLKEERTLKYDDAFADQWVGRTFVRDWLGNTEVERQWAPLGSVGAVAATTERFGIYGDSESDPGILAVDPMRRARRVTRADGTTTGFNYTGLMTRITKFGVQGGSVSSPTAFDQTLDETVDIFGRIVDISPAIGAVTTREYDELDRPTRSHQVDGAVIQTRETRYDPLGRITLYREPERGTMWFGSHSGDVVNADGYDALGNTLRYQTTAGSTDPQPYHFRQTYDLAGRLTLVERERDAAGGVHTPISAFVFDSSANGDGTDSHKGRLGRATSYDDTGVMAFQTDYFYQEAFGRLDRTISSFGSWNSPRTTYYGYDALGQISTTTYPTNQPPASDASTSVTVQRRHGASQSISSNRGPMVTGAFYDHGGALKQWNAFSGVKTYFVPDSDVQGRVQEYKVTDGSGRLLWTTGLYEFDGGGNIKSVGTDIFAYDGKGRLVESQMPGPTGGTLYRETYAYDAFDNLFGKALQINGGLPEGTLFNIDSSSNRIRGLGAATNWGYTDDGALSHDDYLDYGYDNAGRLSVIQHAGDPIARYSYDATGARVYRREDHAKEVFYFRGLAGEVLSQYSRPAGSTDSPQWDRDFIYLDGQRVAMIENPVPGGPSWKVTSSAGATISLAWFTCPDPDIYGYVVYRKGPGEADYSPIYATGLGITTSGTTYSDSSVTSGATYWYKVACVDSAGNEGPASPERPITHLDSVAPPPPNSLSATPGNAIVTLQWGPPAAPPADFAGFYVYRRLSSQSYGAPLNSFPLLTPYYEDLTVTNGTLYYYIVKSVDTAGVLSTTSNEVSARPKVFQQSRGPSVPSGPDDLNRIASVREDLNRQDVMPFRTTGDAYPYIVTFLHHDHLGSLRLVTSASGSLQSLHKYLAYGQELQSTPSRIPFGYAGYERDGESGMNYALARYYHSSRGRFLTADPLGEGFEFVKSNPINFVDPSGLRVECSRSRTCRRSPDGSVDCPDWGSWDCHEEPDDPGISVGDADARWVSSIALRASVEIPRQEPQRVCPNGIGPISWTIKGQVYIAMFGTLVAGGMAAEASEGLILGGVGVMATPSYGVGQVAGLLLAGLGAGAGLGAFATPFIAYDMNADLVRLETGNPTKDIIPWNLPRQLVYGADQSSCPQ